MRLLITYSILRKFFSFFLAQSIKLKFFIIGIYNNDDEDSTSENM